MDSIAVGKLWEYAYGSSSSLEKPDSTHDPYMERFNGGADSWVGTERMMFQGEVPLRSNTLPDFVFPCIEVRVSVSIYFR